MTNYNDPVGVRKKKLAAASALAIALAVPAEGLRQWAYYDIADPTLLTVCYGSTTDVQAGKVYSLGECRARLDNDMRAAIETVERCAPGLPEKTLAALGDAVYNLGPKLVCDPGRSTLARYLRDGRVSDACEQLPRWSKARVMGVPVALPGLTKRRAVERALCLEGLA